MRGVRESTFVLVMLCLAGTASAQTSSPVVTLENYQSIAEVTLGGSIQGPADVNARPTCEQMALPCESGRTFPDFGVVATLTVYPRERIGFVGEVSSYANAWFSYQSVCPYRGGPPPCVADQANHVRSALAGIKIRSHLIDDPSTHWRLFGQVLGGPQWSDVGPPHHVIQVGVGADEYLRNGFVLHVEYDYRFVPSDTRDLSTGRYLIAIGIPLGSHDGDQSTRRSLKSSVGTKQRSLRPKTL